MICLENLNQKTKQQSEGFENTSVIANKTVSKNDKQESVNKVDTKDAHTVSASKIEKNDKNNLSDINNSSYVESSPVFSHEETKLPNELENIVQNSVNATILPEINLSEIQDFNTKVDEILSKVVCRGFF